MGTNARMGRAELGARMTAARTLPRPSDARIAMKPLPLLPAFIRFQMTVDGAKRSVEVPREHADKPVPFCPVLTFELLHGARVFVTRGKI